MCEPEGLSARGFCTWLPRVWKPEGFAKAHETEEDQVRQAPMITGADLVDPETAVEQDSFARGCVSPRVCPLEFQETVEVPEVESADQERQVPAGTDDHQGRVRRP